MFTFVTTNVNMKRKEPLMRTEDTLSIWEIIIDLFAGPVLWLLIWAGALISLLNSDELILATMLFFSGLAWLYKDVSQRNKK